MNFLEALAKIRTEDSKLTERVVAVDRLTAEADGLYAAGERLQLSDKGFEQLCARFRREEEEPAVPARYLNSLPRPISTPLLRHHLNAGLDGGDTIALYSRGQDVIGIGKAGPGPPARHGGDGSGARRHGRTGGRAGNHPPCIRG